MTPTLPDISLMGRYSLAETAQALGIHRNTLRRYINSGVIKVGMRKATNRLFVSGAEINKFWQSHY